MFEIPVSMVPWSRLPVELWELIASHLAEMDRIVLFWTLWRSYVVRHRNIATCYRLFLNVPNQRA